MRTLIKATLVICVLLLAAGCPIVFPGQYHFTNADLSGANYRTGLFFGAAPEDAVPSANETASREVVEPDVIRRDGNILYVLNQYRGLTLIDLDAQTILAQVPTYGYPRDLYIVGNRAYVLVGYADNYTTDGNTISFSIASRLYVVDISSPAQAATVGQFDLKGDLVDSRLVGDVLYAVGADYQWYWAEPAVVKEQTSSSWVTSVNVADPNNIHQVAEVSFDGLGNVIQATNFAIFVAASDWNTDTTTITYVDISDPAGAISVRGNITVHGYVADRFKIDAFQGVLRVVSNEWNWQSQRKVYVTTVDLANPDDLKPLGESTLEDAIGETAFATRFDGPRAYIVTYLVKDPLFVMDLSDPKAPKISGKLVVPGWSTHIEPRGDRLIALGVDDANGRRVCVSMFDVTDPANPVQVGDKATFGDNWSWTSAYSDVKAFTVLDNVIIVPFSGWNSSFGGYDRLQFISYTRDGLEAKGYVDVNGQVLRSFEYNGKYYGVTSEQLATIDGTDLANPTVVHRLTLAEYVADFLELTPALGAEVVTEYNSGKTFLRTVGLEEKALGEVEVNVGSLVKAYVLGSSVVLAGTQWDQTSSNTYYVVAVVDCSTAAAPQVTATINVDVIPYWGYWWEYRGGGVLMDAAGSGTAEVETATASAARYAFAPWMPWWTPQNSTFLLGDILALRCTGEKYDSVFGGDSPYQGLALVNLTELKWTATVGLAYSDIMSMDAVGDKLYIGTQEYAGTASFRPLVANHLRALDVAALSMGPAVNVPGSFMQYDPAGQILVVRDDQWNVAGAVKTNLRSLTWDGALGLEPKDELALPEGVGAIMGRGARVYMDVYATGYYLYTASVASNGDLALNAGLLVTEQWGNLLDAHGATAYVTIENALARYDFTNGGALTDLFQTMGYPLSVRWGTNHAYIALGYSGIAELPL